MKIVHILNTLCIGGRERVVIDICNTIDSKKHDVYIITLTNDSNELVKQLNSNVKVITLPYRDAILSDKCRLWLYGIPKIIRILKDVKPDILHSHLHVQYFLFLSVSLKLSKIQLKYFRTIHTSGLFYSSRSLLDRSKIYVEKWATKIYPPYIVSISQAIQLNNQFFFSKNAKKIKLIPNGVDLDKFSKEKYSTVRKEDFGLNSDKLIVTYIARLDNGKNHSCLVQAWKEVVKKNANVCLLLVGDGKLKEDLIKQTVELGIENEVVFYGSSNQVPEILSISDMGVFPSQYEGFPVSLIEKLAMQLPIVVSNIDVFKEVIINGYNGVLYDVNDAQELAEAILNLIENEDKRIEIGKHAGVQAKQYDINTIVNKMTEYYEEAL